MQTSMVPAEPAARQLARLTAAKWVGNAALRWIAFFLFVLEDAFDATTAQLTLVIGIAEMAGLATLLIGRALDRGRERALLVGALVAVSGSGIIALGGSLTTFAVSFVLVILGLGVITVGGHTWISHRVPFERRGRAIGVFELSWALSLLIGAPLVASLIEVFGWRAPFIFFSVAAAAVAWFVAQLDDGGRAPVDIDAASASGSLGPSAYRAVALSAAIAGAGITTIVIVGTWLERDFGVSTGGVGVTAMAFGLVELAASGCSARYSDRLGKERTTSFALLSLAAGLVTMMVAGSSFAVAVVGLVLFFLGFEYAMVTSFVIVSEAAADARGRVLGLNNAIGTLARAAGAISSGLLFESFGIAGPAALSLIAAVTAVLLLTVRSS